MTFVSASARTGFPPAPAFRRPHPARILFSLAVALALSSLVPAQESAAKPDPIQTNPAQASPAVIEPPAPEITKEETTENPQSPCLEPPPMVRWQDYDGPFHKLVGTLGNKLDRKTAHAPHYKPGAVLCSLELGDKFRLFLGDTLDPVSFLSAGFNAGVDQMEDSDPSYGQGAAGYGKRFAAEYAGLATGNFFSGFVYPAIFGEDPRYYRLREGTTKQRLLHAVGHTVLAHRDDGTRMFNFSEWLGTTTGVVLSNTYHPDNSRAFLPNARTVVYSVATDMGFDILREFWPEIAKSLHMPFRDFHAITPRQK